MSITTTAIQGLIVTPEGVGVPGGTIEFVLSAHGRIKDSANKTVIVCRRYVATISDQGTVAFNLIPSASIHRPTVGGSADTNYVMSIMAGPSRDSQPSIYETVTVPSSGPVEIGDLPLV